jgi:hypothetical protein
MASRGASPTASRCDGWRRCLSAPATQGKGGDCEARQKLGGDQPVVALTGREKMAATAALILACPVVDSRGGVDKRHRGATETTVGARFQ